MQLKEYRRGYLSCTVYICRQRYAARVACLPTLHPAAYSGFFFFFSNVHTPPPPAWIPLLHLNVSDFFLIKPDSFDLPRLGCNVCAPDTKPHRVQQPWFSRWLDLAAAGISFLCQLLVRSCVCMRESEQRGEREREALFEEQKQKFFLR